jgi:hypothetical protein
MKSIQSIIGQFELRCGNFGKLQKSCRDFPLIVSLLNLTLFGGSVSGPLHREPTTWKRCLVTDGQLSSPVATL